MLEHFFKSLVATVSDPYQCNRITDALAAAGIKFYCKSKDVNRHNTFDQARIGTLGIKPRYVTEVFVDKENVDMALHIIHKHEVFTIGTFTGYFDSGNRRNRTGSSCKVSDSLCH